MLVPLLPFLWFWQLLRYFLCLESHAICPFCDRLISLSMKSLWFTHVVACVRISFFFKAAYYSIICICHICFTYLSVDGHLGCCYLLATVNNAAMNMGLLISLYNPPLNSFGHRARSGWSIRHTAIAVYMHLLHMSMHIDRTAVFGTEGICSSQLRFYIWNPWAAFKIMAVQSPLWLPRAHFPGMGPRLEYIFKAHSWFSCAFHRPCLCVIQWLFSIILLPSFVLSPHRI